MGTLSRAEMIDDLLSSIAENIHPVEVFGGSIPTSHPKLNAARKQLELYSQFLLITLHNASKDKSHPYRSYFLFATEGKDENFINLFCLLTDNEDKLFDGGWGYVCHKETALHSLGLYPELDPSSKRYEDQVIALTGVVTSIQTAYPNTESQYEHKDAKLLRYVKMTDAYGDAATADEGDNVVRIANDELAQLVMERPDEWERISRIIIERDTDDVNIILPVLEASVSSLSNGTL